MKEWSNRPPEVANLLNPAFCSFLIFKGVKEYIQQKSDGAPYVFPFVLLPLILHKPTRQIFPRTVSTSFTSWITSADTGIAKIGFSERARNMVPYVKEALVFSIHYNQIVITGDGKLKTSIQILKVPPNSTNDVKECIESAKKCGKWLSRVGDFKTIMALLGITP